MNRDLLIGGHGADRIVGNAGDDILIAGFTSYDSSPGSLRAIMDTWTRPDMSYRDRITKLTSGNGPALLTRGNTAIVCSDGENDVLTGSAGQDWFFFDKDRDRATDLKDEVFADDLTWILL